MLLDHLASGSARRSCSRRRARVIGTLQRRIALLGESERPTVLVEEVFLLVTEPRAGIVEDGRALVGGAGSCRQAS